MRFFGLRVGVFQVGRRSPSVQVGLTPHLRGAYYSVYSTPGADDG